MFVTSHRSSATVLRPAQPKQPYITPPLIQQRQGGSERFTEKAACLPVSSFFSSTCMINTQGLELDLAAFRKARFNQLLALAQASHPFPDGKFPNPNALKIALPCPLEIKSKRTSTAPRKVAPPVIMKVRFLWRCRVFGGFGGGVHSTCPRPRH